MNRNIKAFQLLLVFVLAISSIVSTASMSGSTTHSVCQIQMNPAPNCCSKSGHNSGSIGIDSGKMDSGDMQGMPCCLHKTHSKLTNLLHRSCAGIQVHCMCGTNNRPPVKIGAMSTSEKFELAAILAPQSEHTLPVLPQLRNAQEQLENVLFADAVSGQDSPRAPPACR